MITVRLAARAEWTKLRTVRATGWLALAVVAFTVLAGAVATASASTADCPSPARCFEDTTRLSLTGVWLGQVAVALLAVLAITDEYATGTIGATLAAVPCRPTVLFTKAAVVTGIVAVTGTLGVLGSLAAGRAILPANGFSAAGGYPVPSLGEPPTLRASAGTVLYLVLIGLLALGVATMIRDVAGSIAVVLGLLFIGPVIAQFVSDPDWNERLQKVSPTTAGMAVQATVHLDRLPIGPWAGLGVLGGYAVVAMLLGALALARRDA